MECNDLAVTLALAVTFENVAAGQHDVLSDHRPTERLWNEAEL
jgi:hypothetical protein